jgi:hypothetical protein
MWNSKLALALALTLLGSSEAGSHSGNHHAKHHKPSKHPDKAKPTHNPNLDENMSNDEGEIFDMPVDEAAREKFEKIPVNDWASGIASGHGASFETIDTTGLKASNPHIGEVRTQMDPIGNQKLAALAAPSMCSLISRNLHET